MKKTYSSKAKTPSTQDLDPHTSVAYEREAELTLLALLEELHPSKIPNFLAEMDISDAEVDYLRKKYSRVLDEYRKQTLNKEKCHAYRNSRN